MLLSIWKEVGGAEPAQKIRLTGRIGWLQTSRPGVEGVMVLTKMARRVTDPAESADRCATLR